MQSAVDGRTLAARDADAPRAMASITKLMTVLVALERLALDDRVTVAAAAARVGESSIGLRAGQRVPVRDLVIGALVPSANDAATALAIAASGSVPRFVQAMNRKAEALGLARTRYRNPHGLDRPATCPPPRTRQRSSAQRSTSRRSGGTSAWIAPTLSDGRVVESTDNLLGAVPGFAGGKTGHTALAGWSQVGFARLQGVGITAAVLGSPTEAQRDRDLAALLRFGLASYRPSRVVDGDRTYARVAVGWGRAPLALVAPRTIVRPCPDRQGARRARRRPGRRDAAGPRRAAPRHGRRHRRVARRRALAARRVARRARADARAEGALGGGALRRPSRGARVVIITVTLNAALDRSVTVPILQLGQRHRASDVLTLAGGKGINIARALKRLDRPVVATGLAGGRTGTRIVEELTAEAILNDFVRIAGESRTSTLVVDPTSGTQTEINEWGPKVSEGELEILMDKLRYLSRGTELVVFAGSLPRGVADTFYAEAARELGRRGVRVVLDTEGEPLRLGLESEPWLVSPNQHEAEQLVGQELFDDDDFLMALDAIAELGARNVHITLENGCFALVREERQVRRYRAVTPRLEPVSVVGAGDALLAQWLTAILDGQGNEEALRLAAAAGAASVLEVGAGRFDPAEAAPPRVRPSRSTSSQAECRVARGADRLPA